MLRRKGSRPEAENALMVGDFPARTDDARSAGASDVEDATVQRARWRVWRLVHEPMNGRDVTWVSNICQTKDLKGREGEAYFGDDVKYHGIQVQSKRSLTK